MVDGTSTPVSEIEVQTEERIGALAADDGYPLEYRVWGASGEAGTLVMLHGAMSHSLWLARLAGPLAALGFKVVGADRRGSGLNRSARGDAPSSAQLVADLWRIVEGEHPGGRPLYLLGWCWGAVLALNALALGGVEARGRVEGLLLLAPALFPSRELREAMAEGERAAEGRPIDEPTIPSPIREEMFTTGPWLDGFILADDLRVRSFTPRLAKILGEMGTRAVLQLHRGVPPVLAVLAERDVTLEREKTRRTFERLGSNPVAVRSIDCQHGIQFEALPELLDAITPWLAERDPRTSGPGEV